MLDSLILSEVKKRGRPTVGLEQTMVASRKVLVRGVSWEQSHGNGQFFRRYQNVRGWGVLGSATKR